MGAPADAVVVPAATGSAFYTKARYTNKLVMWYEYPFWLDGSKLSDPKNKDKFNDILFKKVGDRYYKAQVDGDVYNIEDWGVKRDFEGGKPAENTQRFQAMLNYFPEGHAASIFVPVGTFPLAAKRLAFSKRPFHVYGVNGSKFSKQVSHLLFDDGGEVYVEHCKDAIFERLFIQSRGKQNGLHDGMAIRSRITVRDVTVQGFSNNGIGIWANLDDGNEASGSLLMRVHSLENGKDGIWIGGVDANACSVINCDVRDNGRYGITDASFLGNYHYGCMGHNNKEGHYFVQEINAWSSFVACYGEQGVKPNKVNARTVVQGGLSPNQWTRNGKDLFHP